MPRRRLDHTVLTLVNLTILRRVRRQEQRFGGDETDSDSDADDPSAASTTSIHHPSPRIDPLRSPAVTDRSPAPSSDARPTHDAERIREHLDALGDRDLGELRLALLDARERGAPWTEGVKRYGIRDAKELERWIVVVEVLLRERGEASG